MRIALPRDTVLETVKDTARGRQKPSPALSPARGTPRHGVVGACIALTVALSGLVYLQGVPPLWWDEGWTLCVAHNWMAQGHYGCLLTGKPAPPSLAGHFLVVAPVALSFRWLGTGIWQARLVGLVFTGGAFWLLYYLSAKIYDRRVAIGALLVALLLPIRADLHPLLIGRQVLGEIPAVFYLLAGYAGILLAQNRSPFFLLLAIIGWGLALMTKAQVQPFWLASLLIPLAIAGRARRWRLVALLAAGVLGPFAIMYLVTWGRQLTASGHALPEPPLPGLVETQAFALVTARRLMTMRFAMTIGLATLAGLGYATWKEARAIRLDEVDQPSRNVRLMLLTLAGSWFAWFVLLSIGWGRYAFPPVFLATPFVAALLFDLTDGFRLAGIARAAVSLRSRRPSLDCLAPICAMLLIASLAYSFAGSVRSLPGNDTSALQVTDFLNTATAPGSLVETYESELFFLLQRPYHHPPDQIHVELNRRLFLHETISIDYDPLAADPDYLVIGRHGGTWRLYESVLATNAFRPIRSIGPYYVYQRVR